MSRGRIFFNSSPNPTIGVEVELQILDKNTLELASGANDILSEFEDSLHVKEELLDSIIEIPPPLMTLFNRLSKSSEFAARLTKSSKETPFPYPFVIVKPYNPVNPFWLLIVIVETESTPLIT